MQILSRRSVLKAEMLPWGEVAFTVFLPRILTELERTDTTVTATGR